MTSKRNRQARQNDRRDITLMTILANEAAADSRKLLKSYNKPDAKSHRDLEQKLAELYFNAQDKVQLEKEMAAIHPHRKWLAKYIEPEVKVVETKVEEKSNADGCSCEYCREQRRAMNRASCPCAMNRNWEQKSNADGITQTPQKQFSAMDLIAPIAVIGIITLGFVAVMKLSNK
jgi:hypothetical protein